jgi:hypothetical protein
MGRPQPKYRSTPDHREHSWLRGCPKAQNCAQQSVTRRLACARCEKWHGRYVVFQEKFSESCITLLTARWASTVVFGAGETDDENPSRMSRTHMHCNLSAEEMILEGCVGRGTVTGHCIAAPLLHRTLNTAIRSANATGSQRTQYSRVSALSHGNEIGLPNCEVTETTCHGLMIWIERCTVSDRRFLEVHGICRYMNYPVGVYWIWCHEDGLHDSGFGLGRNKCMVAGKASWWCIVCALKAGVLCMNLIRCHDLGLSEIVECVAGSRVLSPFSSWTCRIRQTREPKTQVPCSTFQPTRIGN